jgi:plasmid stability protein
MGRGRAPKGEYAGKTEVMSFRLTPDTKAALRRAAATSGRSLSQEAEHRLRRGLDEEEAISKLWGDVKTSAMLRLAAQVVQSRPTRPRPTSRALITTQFSDSIARGFSDVDGRDQDEKGGRSRIPRFHWSEARLQYRTHSFLCLLSRMAYAPSAGAYTVR